MRVSTNQMYDTGAGGIIRNQGDLFKIQNQLSTGRKILAPSDDPVASAQALVVTQSSNLNEMYLENQGNAKSQLALLDAQLGSLTDIVHAVRERVIQAGNGALTNTDRQYIATELQARLDELVALGNMQDGAGDYMFSGFQGATRPFATDPATGTFGYYGDSGQRLLQVEATRRLPTNVAGDDLFMNIRNGNGTFQVTTGGNTVLPPGTINQGTGKVDGGRVSDPGLWDAAIAGVAWSNPANAGDLRVVFTVTGVAPNTVTTYQIQDVSTPGAPVNLLAAPAPYTPGQAIPLQQTAAVPAPIPPATVPIDFGASISIDGTPADGDSFAISQSRTQSLFTTVQNLITNLNSAVGSATFTTTEYMNGLNRELTNLDQAFDNVNRVRAAVGTGLKDIEALANVGADKKVQYAEHLSNLQDLDYASAISDFARKQMQLEAAQKSFAQTSQLSLFSIL